MFDSDVILKQPANGLRLPKTEMDITKRSTFTRTPATTQLLRVTHRVALVFPVPSSYIWHVRTDGKNSEVQAQGFRVFKLIKNTLTGSELITSDT